MERFLKDIRETQDRFHLDRATGLKNHLSYYKCDDDELDVMCDLVGDSMYSRYQLLGSREDVLEPPGTPSPSRQKEVWDYGKVMQKRRPPLTWLRRQMCLNRDFFECAVFSFGGPESDVVYIYSFSLQNPLIGGFLKLAPWPDARLVFRDFGCDGVPRLPPAGARSWTCLPYCHKEIVHLGIHLEETDVYIRTDARFVGRYVVTTHEPEPLEVFTSRLPVPSETAPRTTYKHVHVPKDVKERFVAFGVHRLVDNDRCGERYVRSRGADTRDATTP